MDAGGRALSRARYIQYFGGLGDEPRLHGIDHLIFDFDLEIRLFPFVTQTLREQSSAFQCAFVKDQRG